MHSYVDFFETTYDKERKIWKGLPKTPFYDQNCSFGFIAFEQMRRSPKCICQISDSENTRLTNEEARIQAIRIARAFERLGIQQSDVIGIAGRNTTYLFAVVLACFFHGTAYHAINPNYDKKLSKQLFDITKPKLIFCDGQDLEKIRHASSDFTTQIFTLKNHFEGVPSVLELLEPTHDEDTYRPVASKTETIAILCTSGSTGSPKAINVSLRDQVYYLTNFLTNDDVHYMISTLDWISALAGIVGCIASGATRVISDKPCTPEYFLEIVQKYKVTFTVQSPPATVTLIKYPGTTPEKLKSLRYYMFGGSKLTLNSQKTLQNLICNGHIINAYGFSELNAGLTRNFTFDKKPESSGCLIPGMKAHIVNDDGKNLGPNEVGEIICTHGEKWMGYYGNEDATKEIYDEDGWFHSGDLGYFDDDGYLYIVDRKKELLKYHGLHYYPNQIEEIISQMPNVKETCVFGIFTEEHGDMAAAAVVKIEGSKLTPEDVVDYVRQNIEADYMHLHGGCKLFDAIPTTANGKRDRGATKAIFLDMDELKK